MLPILGDVRDVRRFLRNHNVSVTDRNGNGAVNIAVKHGKSQIDNFIF